MGRIAVAAGSAALLWVGFSYWGAARFQRAGNRRLDQLRAARAAAPARAASAAFLALPPAAGAELGRIVIPSLGVAAVIVQGTGAGALRHAVGHWDGSALPGQPGNVVLAGHRDTFFRPLRNIREGQVITLQTSTASFRYRVQTTAIVSPADLAVLAPSRRDILTLVTCYPFYYIGPAPRRFIVRARRLAPPGSPPR